MRQRFAGLCTGLIIIGTSAPAFAQPQYNIINLGTVNAADSAVQGLGISPGGVGFGR